MGQRIGQSRRHHYVPQFYLEHFTDPGTGLLQVYEEGRATTYSSTPKNVALERDYNTVHTIAAEQDSDLVEQSLAGIEGIAAQILRKILAGSQLTLEERVRFSFFLALTHLRVPAFRAMVSQLSQAYAKMRTQMLAANTGFFEQAVMRHEQKSGKPLSEPIREQLRQSLHEANFAVQVPREVSICLLAKARERGADLCGMQWTILEAPA